MLAGRQLNKHGAALEKALSPNVTHLVLGVVNLTLVDCLVCHIGTGMAIACFTYFFGDNPSMHMWGKIRI